jgi:anti-anti-sigma factor
MDLRITTSTVGDVCVVAIDGTADLAAAPALQAALQRASSAAAHRTLAVDVDGAVVLDDVALGLLVGADARARASGSDMVVVCTATRMLERFAQTRLDRILTIRDSISGRSGNPAAASTTTGPGVGREHDVEARDRPVEEAL